MNYTQWKREHIAIVAFVLLIAAINPVYGIWMYFVIYFPAHFLNYAWHYGEHYGSYCFRGDTSRDAVGIYNKWYNILCFNSGYHQEHHHKPGVHWTKQPEITHMLPDTRVKAQSMHIMNVPWKEHFRFLIKL